jgi:hypothetical protein
MVPHQARWPVAVWGRGSRSVAADVLPRCRAKLQLVAGLKRLPYERGGTRARRRRSTTMAVAAWPSTCLLQTLRGDGAKPGGGCHRLESPGDVPGRFTPSPRPGAMGRGAPNLLARQCDVERPDHVWVGDLPSG